MRGAWVIFIFSRLSFIMTENTSANSAAAFNVALGGILDVSAQDIAPDPRRTWRHRLAHTWDQVKGCVCSGVATQGSVHGLCVAFAAVTGAGGGGISRIIPDAAVNAFSRGAIGLTGTEILQYALAPSFALAMSYGVDKWRRGQFTWSKAGVTLLTCALAVPLVNTAIPHRHDAEMARIWLSMQTEEFQQNIKNYALFPNERPEDIALRMCSTDPRMNLPAYRRVLNHFGQMPSKEI